MPSAYMKDGAVIRVHGMVAGHPECCCGPPPCACPACDGSLSIRISSSPDSFWMCYEFGQPPHYYASWNDDPTENTHGGMSAEMYCEADPTSPNGIVWRVNAVSSFANYGNSSVPSYGQWCQKNFAGTVAAGADCLPVAGDVTWSTSETVDDGGACGKAPIPTVTVVRA